MKDTITEFYGAETPKDEPPTKKLDGEKARRKALQNWEAYIRSRDNGHTDYAKIARRCDDFYVGEQWDAADKKTLEEEGRPALTINKILPTVNTVLGEQSSKRADVQFKPAKDGTEDVAAALTKVFLHISNANDLDYLEGLVFADGVIQERGYYDIRMDFKSNINGDVHVTVEDPLDILLDPDAKEYDPETWSNVIKTRWMSPDEVGDNWGEKAMKLVQEEFAGMESVDPDALKLHSPTFKGTTATSESIMLGTEERHVRNIRIIERQWAKFERCKIFIDPDSGDTSEIPKHWKDDRVEQFAQELGLIVTEQTRRKIRWTVSAADRVLLEDDWSPYTFFTKVPYFPFFRRGRPFGLVRNLLDPQEQLNKIESQTLHIVNTTANSGYIVEEGALVDMTPDDLRETGAKTGVVITMAPGRMGGLEKIKPNQIPTGLDRIGQKIENNIKEISSVNDARLGQDSAEVSGIALENKQDQGRLQMQAPMDHLAKTRQMMATRILALVQTFYDDERILNITLPAGPTEQQDEQLIINQMDTAGQIVNNLQLGKYDVVVSSMPSRNTYAESQFAQALQMRGAGIMVPDDVVVQFSDLQGRKELAERIRRLTGQADPTPEEMEIAQIQQQLAMAMQQGELQKLGAEIQELQARATQQMARAGKDDAEADRLLEQLESSLQGKREEYQLRDRLATLAADSKESIAGLNAEKDILKTQLKLSADQQIAAQNAQNAPTR